MGFGFRDSIFDFSPAVVGQRRCRSLTHPTKNFAIRNPGETENGREVGLILCESRFFVAWSLDIRYSIRYVNDFHFDL